MKMKSVLGFLVAVTLSFNAHAEKIAVVGLQEALLSSQAHANFRKSLKSEFSKDQQKLLDLEKQVKAVRTKIEKNKDLASKDELKQMQIQHQKVFVEYQKSAQSLQQRGMQREQAFLQEMKPKLDKVVRELITKEGYDVVLAKKATVFSKNELDITAKVVEMLNKQ